MSKRIRLLGRSQGNAMRVTGILQGIFFTLAKKDEAVPHMRKIGRAHV